MLPPEESLLHCMSMPCLNNRRFNLLLDDPAGEWGQRSPHDQRPRRPAAAAKGPACAAAQRNCGGLLRRVRQRAPHQPPAAQQQQHRRVRSLPSCTSVIFVLLTSFPLLRGRGARCVQQHVYIISSFCISSDQPSAIPSEMNKIQYGSLANLLSIQSHYTS